MLSKHSYSSESYPQPLLLLFIYFSVCMCVCTCMCMTMCVEVRCQPLVLFFSLLPTLLLETRSSSGLEMDNPVELVISEPRTFLYLPLQYWNHKHASPCPVLKTSIMLCLFCVGLVCVTVSVWESEANLPGLVLYLQHVGARTPAQVPGLFGQGRLPSRPSHQPETFCRTTP